MTRFCPKCQAETERNKKGDCKPCARIRKAKKYAENPQKAKDKVAAWRKANPEKAKATKDAWQKSNLEKSNATKKIWALNNPEKIQLASVAYRAKETTKANAKIRMQNWRKSNPEKVKLIEISFREKNRSKLAEKSRTRYLKDPKKSIKRHIDWVANNRGKVKIIAQNRRARQMGNGGKLSKGLAEKLFNLQKGKCPCCKQPLGDNYHLDHIVPLALGGSNTDDNIQLLRQQCNNQKHAKHPIDFMQQRGFLL